MHAHLSFYVCLFIIARVCNVLPVPQGPTVYFFIFSIPCAIPLPSLSASLLNPLPPISFSLPPVTVLEPSIPLPCELARGPPPVECVPLILVVPVVYAPLPSRVSAVLVAPEWPSVIESAKELMFWRRPSEAS